MKPRHDVDTSDSEETTEMQAPRLEERFQDEEHRGVNSGKRFWIQIAATIISPFIVAGVLWFGTFMGNTATKNDVKEFRTEIKGDLDRLEKKIEEDVKELRTDIKGDLDRVEKKIEEQTERIDRLLLHLVPQGKK